MPVEIPDNVFAEAVREFWRTRAQQIAQHRQRGGADVGFRAAATGGKQMLGFARKIQEMLKCVGLDEQDIFLGPKAAVLPGFYRPSKEWDLLVVRKGRLLAAVELKSQMGPSFGNNFNNRVEEAIGTAVDLWTAHREMLFEAPSSPWLGYFLVLENCEASHRPVHVQEPHFKVLAEFQETSYAQRYELFCRKLVHERQYTAACLLLVKEEDAVRRKNYEEPANDLSAKRFLVQLLAHVMAELSAEG
jgi:hypothetical protein